MSGPRLSNAGLRDLAKWAGEQGWTWEHCGSGHLRWRHPEVKGPVFTAASPKSNGKTEEKSKLKRALKRAREAKA
jgi:hypothetical protein